MIEWISELGMQRGNCFPWGEFDKTLYTWSAKAIAFEYYLIPLILIFSLQQLGWVPARRTVIAFALFIFFCGTGHLVDDVMSFYYPAYRIMAIWKFLTAVVSAWALFELPQAIVDFALRTEKLRQLK